MNQIEKLSLLYTQVCNLSPERVETIAGAGSNRSYYRLIGQPTLIGVIGTSATENKAFIELSKHFISKGLPMPKVLIHSNDFIYYLQEDLGDCSLFDYIKEGRNCSTFQSDETKMLTSVIRYLPRIQFEGGKGLDYSVCYPRPAFDRRCIEWDLNYFKYCFLKTTGLEFEEEFLQNDFERLADNLLQADKYDTFLYRDFQSRNVMLKEGFPFFIDFQGGRKGPIHYDVASFLWQAKANFPINLREQLIDEYINAAQPYAAIDTTEFRNELKHFVLFRTLQVLGAYGFRGLIERKLHFIESIPFAIDNVRQLLKKGCTDYPYLSQVLERLTTLPQLQHSEKKEGLTVKVMSFSYRKGIPQDNSGNGGGYVFDCRAIHNPGKYEPYKKLIGLDQPVIEFLESDGEITDFLSHVYPIVDFHVEAYLKRGFTDLSICFGCTGGQHRSVYSAQHVAEHIHEKYGVKVHLIHREQHIDRILE